jgi:hypothetical protein
MDFIYLHSREDERKQNYFHFDSENLVIILSFIIYHLSFIIYHLSFVIYHLSFMIYHFISDWTAMTSAFSDALA